MKDGFIKVAAATPEVRVADCVWNGEQTIKLIEEAERQGVKVLVFPELGITGYTCGDLFLSQKLIEESYQALCELKNFTSGKYPVVVVGLPITRIYQKLKDIGIDIYLW